MTCDTKPGLNKSFMQHQGVWMWENSQPELFPEFRTRDSDVWVCSFPRSGRSVWQSVIKKGHNLLIFLIFKYSSLRYRIMNCQMKPCNIIILISFCPNAMSAQQAISHLYHVCFFNSQMLVLEYHCLFVIFWIFRYNTGSRVDLFGENTRLHWCHHNSSGCTVYLCRCL